MVELVSILLLMLLVAATVLLGLLARATYLLRQQVERERQERQTMIEERMRQWRQNAEMTRQRFAAAHRGAVRPVSRGVVTLDGDDGLR